MKKIVEEIAYRIRDTLKENIEDFEGLYVYGSQVRGDATEESDMDIVVLFKQEYIRMPEPYNDLLFQMGIEYFEIISLDVLPYTREELQRNYSFHDEVVNKGIYYGA